MASNVQVVSCPTADTPGSCLLLHFDNTRYAFGQMSEGTQRVMTQRKLAMTKLESIFMTGPTCWKNNGGLLGMILTIAGVIGDRNVQMRDNMEDRRSRGLLVRSKEEEDAKDRPLHVFGPERLCHMLATARRFIFRQSLVLRPHEIRGDPSAGLGPDRDPDYRDQNIRVWYLPIWPANKEYPEATTTGTSTAAATAAPAPATTPEPASPKKRSHDEMSGEEEQEEPDFESMQQEEKYKFVREVVSHMFESTWNIDEVVKTTLRKARLPAKLFIKDDQGKLTPYVGPMPQDGVEVPNVDVYVRQPWPGAKINRLPPTKPSGQSLCYVVMTHQRRGKFNPAQAVKHGIPPLKFKKLAQGESLEGTDGVLVTPDMVLGTPLPAQGFAVIDIPDASYIDSLLGRPEMCSNIIKEQVAAIYWFLGPGVVTDPRLEAYIQSNPRPKHIISSPDAVPNYLALESSARVGFWLKMLDSKRFGDLHFTNIPELRSLPGQSTTASMTGRTIKLGPRLEFEDSKASEFMNLKKVIENCNPKALELAKEADRIVANPEFHQRIEEAEKDIPNRDAEIITLGTGSALPSKYRNVSATLIRVPGVGNYLLDCGENTLGQMRRCFGPELPSILCDLKFIWISHLHADHHLGTASVIRAWHEATLGTDATLDVAGFSHMESWLSEYSAVEDIGYASGKQSGRVKFHLMQSKGTEKKCVPVNFREVEKGKGDPRTGLARIDAVFVNHCFGALAVCLAFPSGLKIAYSGDCRPSVKFAEMARDATLLIHEATFGDDFAGEAVAKKHCTISEAMEVARKMQARRVMLTHFSQRYPKIARIDDGTHAEVKDQAVLFAFDLMRVKLGEWREAQQYWPAMKELISEDEQDLKEE
ncbi:hypothetical protein MKZ38_010276 [Zalerion maritima]|uniref:ribonuclease Z n=1 Tax=Zalerion maritima TaxID=339359 RepID=A0AAD5RG02_9PEZI|nr:hypothetical protein MKZ38_010276 [Zalerion maritima]